MMFKGILSWARAWRWAVPMLLALDVSAQSAAPPPVQSFFATGKFGKTTLSPDGRWLAALNAPPGRRIGFSIIDLDGKEETRFIEASPKDDVTSFHWVGNDWLIFTLTSPDQKRVRFLGTGLMAMKRDGSSPRKLIVREFEQEDPFQRTRYLDPFHFFMQVGATGTTEIVVGQLQYREGGGSWELSHVTPKIMDIATMGVRSVPGDVPRSDWQLFDVKGQPRVASYTSAGTTTVWWADKAGAWKEISKAPQFERLFTPQFIDGDDGLIVSTGAREDGSLELRRFNFATGKPGGEPLLATPGFSDVDEAVVDLRSGKLHGIGVTTDAQTQIWFDPKMKALQEKVDAKLPGKVNFIQCRPCDGTGRLVISSYSDTDPGSYVLYTPADDRWRLVGQVRAEIEPRQMANLELHRTKARDGRDLPVWITKREGPAGTPVAPAPAVVLVHGGPWSRGAFWRFNSEAQFLASRGYVVIEPEFRGSLGYGFDHFQAGWKQWGQKMQDDISDAMLFAVKQGWVDKSRVCIMGASYGGYATLMGLVKNPDQYRCGVAFAAVSDPRYMYDFHWNDLDSGTRGFELPTLLGDRTKDAAMLEANSPVVHANRIKAPLLLAHGRRDYRVPIENAERMRDALAKNGTPLEWVVYDEEFHGFFYDRNRIDYYTRVEAFLAKYLKPTTPK